MKKLLAFLLMLLLALPALPARAEEAQDITYSCLIQIYDCVGTPALMWDRNRNSTADDSGKDYYPVYITPKEEPVAAVYVEFGKVILPFRVESKNSKGEWQTIAHFAGNDYPQAYVTFPPQSEKFRIVFYPKGDQEELAIREIFLLSAGEVGSHYNHRWQPPVEKADLMVLVAHPDDEVLWMGGTLPWYAGELGMQVEVCYLTCSGYYRTLELLNGLWQCGVHNYPEIGDFFDYNFNRVGEVYSVWSRKSTEDHIVRLIRKYRPEVLVTHDILGEYGHTEHIACAECAIRAVELAADPTYDPESFEQYGAWEVKKLYLHLGEEPTTVLDWSRPMAAFGGRDGFEVAEAAYQCHDSQLWTSFEVARAGTDYDSTLYTLLRSTVGEDEAGDDFFEHIPEDCLSTSN
ncbi:MAG: PIG-L family deacetylase [Clostridia bacterium]|nr:PIG-L family deacetylase [Clostridia bacterium]